MDSSQLKTPYTCKYCTEYRADCLEYDYQHFKFCPGQIIFVLMHPNEELIRGRVACPIQITKNTKSGAYSYPSKSSDIRADIGLRLQRIGQDGELLQAQLNSRYRKDGDISGLSANSLFALYYISGLKPKATKYSQWKASRKQHKKESQSHEKIANRIGR